jgi:hypothetical protein
VKLYEASHGLGEGALKTMAKSTNVQDKIAALAQLKEAHIPGYQVNLFIFAGVYFAAMFLWMMVDATRPVAEER